MKEKYTYSAQPVAQRKSKTYDYPPLQTCVPSSAGHHIEEDNGETDEPAYERLPTSVIRYTTSQGEGVIERGNQQIRIHQGMPKQRYPWMLLLCIGMLVALTLVYAYNSVSAWWTAHQMDSDYGFPRTYQTDAVVYPGDSADHPSHYIFLNLNGTVQIIELPHGDSGHARIYKGPTLFTDNADLIPVTGEFKQVNGKEEMLVHIGDQTIIYVSDGTQFKPQG